MKLINFIKSLLQHNRMLSTIDIEAVNSAKRFQMESDIILVNVDGIDLY